jgi:diguanylate cyclase (GGDEF)-like protein/PAS domain S-box-containing protein
MSGPFLALALVAGLTVVDAVIVLASPEYARTSAPISILIAWLDVVVVAYFFGMFAGIVAACTTAAFDALILHAAGLDHVTARGDVPLVITILIVELVAAAVIGRLREMSRRIRDQLNTLQEGDRRFRTLTEHGTDLIAVIDATGKPTFASQSHFVVLGYEPERVLKGDLTNAFDESSQRKLGSVIARSLRGEETDPPFDVNVRHADGSPRILEISVKNRLNDAAIRGIVLCARDITDQKRAEETLEHQALRDSLTGLPNRKHLRARLDEQVAIAARMAQPLAVLFIDLDRFKDVNDALGHHWGDALLCDVAGRLRSRVRDEDLVARLGGDEFAILLPDHGVAEATAVAERIVKSLVAPYRIAGQTLVVGASIGISVSTEDSDSASLLRQADIAMYVAKRGRSGVAVFSMADDQEAQRRLGNATSLHDAIANDRLLLYYQPQIALKSGAIIGVEALLRWDHPERGLLEPQAFIPLAEEIGMMGPLTEWVLRTSLRQVKRWRRAGIGLRLAVNMSPFNLRDSRLTNTISRLLALYDIPATHLCLEFDESGVAAEADRAGELLSRFSTLGVRISIDDFGTGYSALSQLRGLPVDELKIDRSFVLGMLDDPHDAAIVGATVELAHKFGIDAVIEGVENQATWDAVSALGADAAQGNFMKIPLPAEEFEVWLRDYTPVSVSA